MKNANVTDERGFTLIEIIFVLAIILVLISLIVPVAFSKLRDAQLARANADIQTIMVALISFQTDLGHFPACDSNDCDPLIGANQINSANQINVTNQINGANQTLRFLAFGDGRGDIQDSFPVDDPALVNKWNLRNPINLSVIPARNNGFNHLGRNDPNADNITGSDIEGAQDYNETESKSKRWKGPYITNVSSDPWGHAYIVHVGAMEKDGIPVFTTFLGSSEKPEGWILSAGPDGTLQTSPTDTILSGDDIGLIFFTSKSKRGSSPLAP